MTEQRIIPKAECKLYIDRRMNTIEQKMIKVDTKMNVFLGVNTIGFIGLIISIWFK